MKFCICIPKPRGFDYVQCFREVAETTEYWLSRRKHQAHISYFAGDIDTPGATPIILAPHLVFERGYIVPEDSIMYNMEQVGIWGTFKDPKYIEWLKQHTVWDYNPDNVGRLADKGVKAHLVKVGGNPNHRRIQRRKGGRFEHHDAVFFGWTSARRAAVVAQLRAKGYSVFWPQEPMWGVERDSVLSHATCALNVHFSPEHKLTETVRISYYLENDIPVISERGIGDPDLCAAMVNCDYDGIVKAAEDYIEGRIHITKRGSDIMDSREMFDEGIPGKDWR